MKNFILVSDEEALLNFTKKTGITGDILKSKWQLRGFKDVQIYRTPFSHLLDCYEEIWEDMQHRKIYFAN